MSSSHRNNRGVLPRYGKSIPPKPTVNDGPQPDNGYFDLLVDDGKSLLASMPRPLAPPRRSHD